MTRRNTARANGGNVTIEQKPQQAPQPTMSLTDADDRQWLQAKVHKLKQEIESTGREIQYAMQQSQIKRLDSDSGSGGGYLVPTEHIEMIMHAIDQRSIVTRHCKVVNLTHSAARIPRYDGAGVTTHWVAEGEAIAESDFKLGVTEMAARKLAAIIRASKELVDDAALADTVAELFAASVANEMDRAALVGSGMGEPLGILNSPSTLTVNRTTASQIAVSDIGKMLARFVPSSIHIGYPPVTGPKVGPVWIAHPSALEYLTNNPERLYLIINSGIPLLSSEHLPQLSEQGCLLLADLGYYVYALRSRFNVAASDQTPTAWAQGERSYRITARVDGSPWLAGPITSGGYQYSPFVALA